MLIGRGIISILSFAATSKVPYYKHTGHASAVESCNFYHYLVSGESGPQSLSFGVLVAQNPI